MIEHNRDGFLVGRKLGGDESDRWLAAIKGDTGKILAAMRQGRGSRTATPAGRSGAGASASRPAGSPAVRGQAPAPSRAAAMAPASRAAASPARLRDASGRYVAAPARTAPDPGSRRVADVAAATEALARTAEQQRRDSKADQRAANQKRGNDGRFGAGAGGSGGGMLGAIAGQMGRATDGAEQVDPLLGSIAEARGLINRVRDVAAPMGRSLMGLGRGGGIDGQPTGLLRRMWRELRAMRKADATASKSTLSKLAELAKLGPGGAGAGGGIMGAIARSLPSLAGPMAAAGGGAAAAMAGGKAVLKRLPIVGALVEAITGAIEDRRIAGDASLSDAERAKQRAENIGSTGGGIGGALAGAAIGQALIPIPLVGAAIGAIGGGLAGSALGKRGLGAISARFESGKGGAGAVSTGKGDFGGASYGTHQLSSKTGTLQNFLASSGYGAQFAGLQPGTPEFNARWKQMAGDPSFGQAQKDFIGRTHFEPQMAHLKAGGMDLSGKGDAVKEAVWSTSVQFGGKTDLIKKALAGRDVAGMSDAETIAAIQDYKLANNASLFKSSSPAVQAGTLRRAGDEKAALLALSGQSLPSMASASIAAPRPLSIPAMPASPVPAVVAAMPQVDMTAPTRLNSAAPAPAPQAPAQQPGQDVRDRLIAHIVTGGIAGGVTLR